jgi:hypothetical protein
VELKAILEVRGGVHLTPELCQEFFGNYEKRLKAILEVRGGPGGPAKY